MWRSTVPRLSRAGGRGVVGRAFSSQPQPQADASTRLAALREQLEQDGETSWTDEVAVPEARRESFEPP